jgi:hypothetical protein
MKSQPISFIIPVYLQSVQVRSVNLLNDVDKWLGEGRSSIVRIGSGARCDWRDMLEGPPLYTMFQKELYNFERVYKFIQRTYITF